MTTPVADRTASAPTPRARSLGLALIGRLSSACLGALLIGTLLACTALSQMAGDVVDAAAPDREWTRQDLDALVAPLIGEGWMMGLVVGIRDGERTEIFSYGKRGRGDERPLDGHSVFEIGSVTKVFTGLLLADAVLRDEVTLDTPVGVLLPGRAVVAPRADEQPITLLDLATHTSGLPRLPTNFAPADWQDPYADYDIEDLYAGLASLSLTHKERTRYGYSNLGVGVLGQALAIAGGKNYESLVQRRICKPLGLGDTRIQLDDERHVRFVAGHAADLNWTPPWNLGALEGAGALRSTAIDMLAFGGAFLARGDDPELAELERAAAMTMVPRRPSDSPGYMVGLGWHIDTEAGVWLHTGQTGGYAASLSVIPERDQVVVILTNTATSLVAGLAQRIRALIDGRPVEFLPLPEQLPLGPEQLAEYVGYYSGFGVNVEITQDERGLLAHFTEPRPLRIYPLETDRFIYRTVEAALVFERDESGQPVFVVLEQDGNEIKMLRVEDESAN